MDQAVFLEVVVQDFSLRQHRELFPVFIKYVGRVPVFGAFQKYGLFILEHIRNIGTKAARPYIDFVRLEVTYGFLSLENDISVSRVFLPDEFFGVLVDSIPGMFARRKKLPVKPPHFG